MAHISTRYPRGNCYPSRNTTALRHNNWPEPYQGLPMLTPPAVTALQGRDPHHIIPGYQRDNHGLHIREYCSPRADHIVATRPPVFQQHLYRAFTKGDDKLAHGTIQELIQFIRHLSRTQSGGGHRFQKRHTSASPTTTTRLNHNGTLEGFDRTQIRVSGSHTRTRV